MSLQNLAKTQLRAYIDRHGRAETAVATVWCDPQDLESYNGSWDHVNILAFRKEGTTKIEFTNENIYATKHKEFY